MTLKELQQELGNQIELVKGLDSADRDTAKFIMDKSDLIARLAKQMINNADVVLRTDKLLFEGKLEPDSTIVQITYKF